MKNLQTLENDNPYKVTTRKYLSFFKKIASHPALTQNIHLSQITDLCIVLAEKHEASISEQDHESIHRLLRACMKTIQEVFMMVIEKRTVTVETLTELNLHIEELKVYIANFDEKSTSTRAGLEGRKTGKNSTFKQFLENSRNQHLISISPETFEEPLSKQAIDFRRDVQKILHPHTSSMAENKSSTGFKTITFSILLFFFILSAIGNGWLLFHYNTKIDSLEAQISTLENKIKTTEAPIQK